MATAGYTEFRTRMHDVVLSDGGAEVRQLTHDYWHTDDYTGPHFDRLRDAAHPNEITERDILAVSMLSVTIPPRVVIWLLSHEGRVRVGELLSQIPPDGDIRSDGDLLQGDGPALELWKVLAGFHDMGRTKTSKLLAAKRPHLIPVYDSVIERSLGPVADYWDAYRFALADSGAEPWVAATEAAPDHVSFLRRLDAALWMHGTQPRQQP